MANQRQLTLTIIAAATVAGLFLSSASVKAASLCNSKAECACEIALNSGSRNTLRQFLLLYPRSDTACNAQASTDVVVVVGQGNPIPDPQDRKRRNYRSNCENGSRCVSESLEDNKIAE
jgi:hypothetical protein